MFNLEHATAEWRRQMTAAGFKNPSVLDELEIHLREDIEEQMKLKPHAQEAFEAAVRRMGEANALTMEFKKAGLPIELRFVKLMGVAIVVIAGLFSLRILYHLFAIPVVTLFERMLGLVAVALIILSWRHGDRLISTSCRPWVRAAIGVLCGLASFGGMILFINSIVSYFTEIPAGADLPIGPLLISFVWAWTGITILGVATYKLGAVTCKYKEQHV